MNIADLLPKVKVTAYVLGAALSLVILWLIVDVFGLLDEWPPTHIVVAWVIIIGFIVAWLVPEDLFTKSDQHTDS